MFLLSIDRGLIKMMCVWLDGMGEALVCSFYTWYIRIIVWTFILWTSNYQVLVIVNLWWSVHINMFISECPWPKIEPSSNVEWINNTGNKSHATYNTVLKYKCKTGYGFLTNSSTHTINTVTCGDNTTFSQFKQCRIKGMKLN